MKQPGSRRASLLPIGDFRGITSVCSAHPLVLEAAIDFGKENDAPTLIEATCNQVNHQGGYTGMTPVDFRHLVEKVATDRGYDASRIILGGDHLGPNPWKHQPAANAMRNASTMVASYVEAGFGKIHLDASMGCADDPELLDPALIADRAADLANVAEQAAKDTDGPAPIYVVGTEVPVPGGSAQGHGGIQITKPDAVRETIDLHRQAFKDRNIEGAFERVIAVVVQPGVEFGDREIIRYDRSKAIELVAARSDLSGIMFEAHSTDYQSRQGLKDLVGDGFSILKVGPELTFVLREALYALDDIASALDPQHKPRSLMSTMESLMLENDGYWRKYCSGSEDELRIQRHFGLSDRIRYYWADPRAERMIKDVFSKLEIFRIPPGIASQYLDGPVDLYLSRGGKISPATVARESVKRTLARYADAAGQQVA